MRLKGISLQTLIVIVFTVVAFSPAVTFYFFVRSFDPLPGGQIRNARPSVTGSPDLPPEQDHVSVGLPMRLEVPGINVDAFIEYVGLTPDGAMDVPKERTNVAWFNLGSRPGEAGSAVIAGHYGWKNGATAAFDNLHKLRLGDKIYVTDYMGETISFVVRESRRYDPKADTSAIFASHDGKSHLNLIACEGVWNKISQSYSKRLVVFADREEE